MSTIKLSAETIPYPARLNDPVGPGGNLILNRTLVMGVLNVTPDSFSDGGKYYSFEEAVRHGEEMLQCGADILDIGGESTRPGAEPLTTESELERVIPVIKALTKAHPEIVISIDTYKSAVAEEAIKSGARMVNDISGLGFDPRMKDIVHKYKVPVIIMHIKGTPRDMQKNPYYADLFGELIRYFQERIELALRTGIPAGQIIIDPGIGFGKRLEDNYEILNRLEELVSLGYPVLVGPSRKSFIGKVLNQPPAERLFGTAAAVAVAVYKGARIIRVHDVRQMSEVIRIAERIRK